MSKSDSRAYRFNAPITHGTGIQAHHRNIDVYDALQQLWREEIGSPEDDGMEIATYTPTFAGETRAIELSSSKWMAGSDPDTPFYEYNLRIQKDGKTPPQSLSVDIIPQKQGMMYKDGNKVKLPYGEGTRIKIQTAYPDEKDDVFTRANELLSVVLDEYESDALDRETGKITKLEKHIRFDRDKMPAVVDALNNSKRLIGWDSVAEIKGRQYRKEEGWDIYRFSASEWHKLGFDTPSGDYKWSIKAYSANSWEHRSDYMHDPKLEAFYGGTSTSNESLPSVEMWGEICDYLSHLVTEHCQWAGVTTTDLVEDPFFRGSSAGTREFRSLEGRKDDLRNMYESMDSEVIRAVEGSRSDVPAQLIRILIDQPEGAFYGPISEELDISKKTIQRHARTLEDVGLIDRIEIGQGGTRLRFRAATIVETARQVMEEMNAGQTAGEARQTDDSGGERTRYRSLAELGVLPSEAATAVSQGDLKPEEVRVPEDWRPD